MKFIFVVKVGNILCDSFFELANDIVRIQTSDFITKGDHFFELALFRHHVVIGQRAFNEVFALDRG